MSLCGVIGGGAWGTALAQVCARAGLEPILWAMEPEVVAAINADHANPLFLPDVELEPVIRATGDLADLAVCDLVLAVAPAQHVRAALRSFAPHARPGVTVMLCAKGIEQGSLSTMAEVLAQTIPAAAPAVLSGPSFAGEVARGLPTAVTLAAPTLDAAQALAETLASPAFRPYASDDMAGAEAGGAVKNVLAIACGVVEGRGLGRSAHAALITRGFAELTRLAIALGGRADTVAGLCGLGDLVLTCSSPQSRNYSVGLALGRGQSLAEALAGKRTVAEGVSSAPAVSALAQRLGVETPICSAVDAILAGRVGVDAAIAGLLSAPFVPNPSEVSMATFALICIDKPDSLDLRMATREAHFDYVRANPGVARLGGPFLSENGDMAGSLILIEAKDLAAAQAFSDHDPYTLAGLFQSRDIRPWRCTFGALP